MLVPKSFHARFNLICITCFFSPCFDTTYLRDMSQYPVQMNKSGLNFNPEPGKCNAFSYRYKLIDGKRHYNEAYPVYIVQHHTVVNFSQTADIFLKGSASAHYVIDKNGKIYQFVADKFRACNAGVGSLAGDSKLIFGLYSEMVNNMNSWSIGIENVNNGNEPYSRGIKWTWVSTYDLRDIYLIAPHLWSLVKNPDPAL